MLEVSDIITCREVLAEQNAILIRELNDTDNSLVGDMEINRAWHASVDDYFSHYREFLDVFTSVNNTQPQKYVDDPMANNEVFTGRWRQAYLRRIRRPDSTGTEISYIVQTLRKGYIESLGTAGTSTSPDWSEARLGDSRDLPAGTEATLVGGNTVENYINIVWNNISPYKIEIIKTFLNGLSADTFAPTIRTQSLGSSWHRLFTASKIEEDGSGTIVMTLAKPEFAIKTYVQYATANGEEVSYIWNCPKTLAQGVVEASKLTGKSCIASYSSAQGLVDLVIRSKGTISELVVGSLSTSNCQIKDYESMYLNVPDPNAYAIPSASTQGVTYDRDMRSNRDGTYDISVTVRQVAQKVSGPFTSVSSVFRKQETLQYRNYQTLLDAPDITGTGIYRLNQSPNQDCTYDADLTYEHGTNTGVFTFESLETLLAESTTSLYRDYEAYINTPEAPQGAIYRASNALTEDGLYNSELEYVRSKELYVAFDRSISSLSSVTEEVYENNKAVLAIPSTATQGIVVQDNLNINQDGTYTQTIVKQESIPSMVYHQSVATGHERTYDTIYQNYRSIPDVPVYDIGVVYSMNINGMNEDGTYNTSIRQSRSLKDVDSMAITSENLTDRLYTAVNITQEEADAIASFFSSNYAYNNNGVSITLNADGTRNITVGSKASNNGGVEFTRDIYWTQYVASCEGELPDDDVEDFEVYKYIKYTYSLQALQDWLAGFTFRFNGTGINYLGRGKWEGTLVSTNPPA